ncbi:MAG: methyltransferase domain-containing protein [Oscillospiraceae bacterium]|nr:methyltransferase domain-containing protein [Oscillospiraceae bacterium]
MRPMCRPGGFEITDRALEVCSFSPAARLLDCGCGAGATVEHFRELGFCAEGVDVAGGDGIIKADAAELPFEDESFDGVFFECSLSKMAFPDDALKEAQRLLKKGGRIAISDFYARGDEFDFSGELLGRAEKQEKIMKRIDNAGFEIVFKEDYSHLADELCASLVFKYGAKGFLERLGADRESLGKTRCGYALFVGVRR